MSVYENACEIVEQVLRRPLPFRERGIKIDRVLIETAVKILKAAPSKTLPQNCRNDLRSRTPDGLDRRIKDALDTDLRTANIVSDILAECGVVEIVQVVNPQTGRMIKGTRLLDEIRWAKVQDHDCTEKKMVDPDRGLPILAKKKNKEIANNIDIDMGKEVYLVNRYVKIFARWLETKLDGPNSFPHEYYLRIARRRWHCNSLYEAYKSYWWPFDMYCQAANQRVSGSGSRECFQYLTWLARSFRSSIHKNNTDLARNCALSMLEWGGVLNRNKERIMGMGESICSYFRNAQQKLNLSTVSLTGHRTIHINSGFTKLYFLLIDDFTMYDGRVGAALGLLVRKFCEENGLHQIPPMLEFSFGSGRGNPGTTDRRDPSFGNHRFPRFTLNRIRHLHDNIKASWLLKEVADKTRSRFKELSQDPPLNERLTALQSALFMIGYDVRG